MSLLGQLDVVFNGSNVLRQRLLVHLDHLQLRSHAQLGNLEQTFFARLEFIYQTLDIGPDVVLDSVEGLVKNVLSLFKSIPLKHETAG